MMLELNDFLKNENIKLVIWDMDGVIYDLDWDYMETPYEFVKRIENKINNIDSTIIKDKEEFISRLFPYPEINEIGLKHGREKQLEVKSLYLDKEMSAVDRAKPHLEVIEFIKKLNLPQVIWSNNYSNTLEYLTKKAEIFDRLKLIVSLDKVVLSKPNIEGFNLIQEQFPDISKNNIVIVGDSLRSDKIAAENTGIKFFHYNP